MIEFVLTFLVIIAATIIEPLNLLLGLLIGATLALLVKQNEFRWALVVVGALALNAALHLPFGGRISIPAVIANILQVALGAWLTVKWKARAAT